MHMNRRRSRSKAYGVGLVEVVLGLAVLSLGMVGMNQVGSDAANQTRALAAATKLEQVHQAAADFVRANQVTLLNATNDGSVARIFAGRETATGADPGSNVAGLGSLQAGGFLPSAYIDRNNFGHRHAVLVRQPSPGRLEFVVTQVGGRAIKDVELGRIAQRLGAAGGAILERPTPGVAANTIVGTGGGWRAAASSWTGGSVTPSVGRAMTYSGLSAANTGLEDYLYRGAVPGNADANRMRTAIDMGGNGLTNVTTLTNEGVSGGAAVAINDNATVAGTLALNTRPGATSGEFASPNNGWVHFTAQGAGVGPGVGGLAVHHDSHGLGGNLVVSGTTEARDTVNANRGINVRNEWARIYGNYGIYWENHGGGLTMADGNWVRVFRASSLYETGLLVDGANGIVATRGEVASRVVVSAPLFRETDGAGNLTGYYADLGGTNRMNYVQANNIDSQGFSAARGDVISHYGNVRANTGGVIAQGDVVSNAGNLHAPNGSAFVGHSVRAQNFIDANDPSYSLDPNGASQLNVLRARRVVTQEVGGANAGCGEEGAIGRSGASLLLCHAGAWRDQAGGIVGRMYGGGGDMNSFACESGYHPVWFHMNVGNTNNAFFGQCVKDGY